MANTITFVTDSQLDVPAITILNKKNPLLRQNTSDLITSLTSKSFKISAAYINGKYATQNLRKCEIYIYLPSV